MTGAEQMHIQPQKLVRSKNVYVKWASFGCYGSETDVVKPTTSQALQHDSARKLDYSM